MIHPAAANAVGEVWVAGERMGHCVLIGRRQAVTCAHVLSTQQDKPKAKFKLVFRRVGFETVTAVIVGWRPYDPSLARGTDLALLTFDEDAPEGNWVALEPRRPRFKDPVVAFEYQTARSDGDPRTATVHNGDGEVISLAGHKFIDPGMSGTGLFRHDPGERLFGLVAWRPILSGQTAAYAIPADEILNLQAELAEGAVSETSMPIFDSLVSCFLAQAGPNLRPILDDYVVAARAVIDKPTDTWTEADINDLLGLHLMVADQNGTDGFPLPPGLAAVLNRLSQLTAELTIDVGPFTQTMPLKPQMAEALIDVKTDVETFRTSGACPQAAEQSVAALLRDVGCALATDVVFPRKLSHNNALVQNVAGQAYRQLGRGIPAILGQRPDLLPAGTIFTDDVASWAPEMVVIPAGRFLMGSSEDEERRFKDEGPQHVVEIGTKFAFARFALTFEEYDVFCAEKNLNAANDSAWGRDRRPVINVNWDDAKKWCAWMAEKAGASYRLPSEAEWEYACRAGATTRYAWGDKISPQDAHYADSKVDQTKPVDHAAFRPNAFGLWQMHGNVWEFCEDDYNEDYASPRTQAPFLSNPRSSRRVLRGGSWGNSPQNLRSASRFRYEPVDSFNNIGFRPARTLLPLSS